MTDAPKLLPYIVALSFAEGGPLHCNGVLAPTEAAATALVTAAVMREMPTDKQLIGVAVARLTPEFLRVALRAYDGDVGKPNIVSIVPQQNQRAAELLRGGGREVYTDPTWPHPPVYVSTEKLREMAREWHDRPPADWQPDDPLDPVA